MNGKVVHVSINPNSTDEKVIGPIDQRALELMILMNGRINEIENEPERLRDLFNIVQENYQKLFKEICLSAYPDYGSTKDAASNILNLMVRMIELSDVRDKKRRAVIERQAELKAAQERRKAKLLGVRQAMAERRTGVPILPRNRRESK